MKALEYDMKPAATEEWVTLSVEQNADINACLEGVAKKHPAMAERFVAILIKGNSAKYGDGHMIRLVR